MLESETLLKKNSVYRLKITDITNEGNGVGRIGSAVVFVPRTAIGDEADIKIVKVNNKYSYGIIDKLINESIDRINVDCEVEQKCGGCAFRHISYEAELASKKKFVSDAFAKIGNFHIEDLEIIPSPKTYGYRNKAQIPIGTGTDGKAVAGFLHSEATE